MLITLSGVTGCFRNKLENTYPGHTFHLYSLISQRGKLSRCTAFTCKSRAQFDSTAVVPGEGVKPNGFGCLTLVTAARTRKSRIHEEVQTKKAKIEEDSRVIIQSTIANQKFNELDNKKNATIISREIRGIIEKEAVPASCSISVVILESNVEYKENIVSTVKADKLIAQVEFKNEELAVIVVIIFLPLD